MRTMAVRVSIQCVLFKMVLIQHLYGLPSLRRTAEEVSGSIYYRWFSGVHLYRMKHPIFSTVSYNFRHRFTEETVDRIFRWILEEVGGGGITFPPKGGLYRRHAHQGQRQHEKAGEGAGSCRIQTLRQGTDGRGKRRPGGPRERSPLTMMTNLRPQQRNAGTTPPRRNWPGGKKRRNAR